MLPESNLESPQPDGNADMSYEMVDEMMEKSKAGDLRSPVSETLGMRLVQFGRGEAVYEMEASEQLGNPLGVIQGGVATALADAAMAAATTTILDDEEIQKSAITTIDIFARFIGRLGLPGHLSEVGVTKEKFELIGRNAMLSIFTRANPRVIKGPEDIVEILQLAA